MALVYGVCGLFGVILVIWYVCEFNWEVRIGNSAFLLGIIAVFVRILAMFASEGFPADISNYKLLSETLHENGLKSFYSMDIFSGYSPGYMYILNMVGSIRHFFRIENELYYTMLIKTPPVIFDSAISVFVLILAAFKTNKQSAWLLGLSWALNPAAIFASAVWGKPDSVYIFFMIFSIYRLSIKSHISAYLSYACAILISPVTLMFMPLYIYSAYTSLKESRENNKRVGYIDNIFPGLMLLLCGILPFTTGSNILPVIERYAEMIFSNPFATMNAANVYAIPCLNYVDVTYSLLPFISVLLILACVAVSFLILYFNRKDDKYYFAAAFLSICFFMFALKMREGYMVQSLACFLCCAALRKRRDYRFFYFSLSITAFLNGAFVMYNYLEGLDLSNMDIPLGTVGFINTCILIFLFYRAYENNKYENQWWWI